jgi:hypothetical protein
MSTKYMSSPDGTWIVYDYGGHGPALMLLQMPGL